MAEMLALLEPLEPGPELVPVLGEMCCVETGQGRPEVGRAYAERALVLAEQLGLGRPPGVLVPPWQRPSRARRQGSDRRLPGGNRARHRGRVGNVRRGRVQRPRGRSQRVRGACRGDRGIPRHDCFRRAARTRRRGGREQHRHLPDLARRARRGARDLCRNSRAGRSRAMSAVSSAHGGDHRHPAHAR